LPSWDGPLETSVPRPAPGDFEPVPAAAGLLDADGAAGLARAGVLLDARAGERYRGEVEPVDPVAGHIPGAVSAPTTRNVGPDGRFLPAEELGARFEELGVTQEVPVGVYCGSGVSGAHEVLALAVAGIPAALYVGSWSEWSSDPRRPVAVGPDPQ
ncbi:sulfurtransferase, partial [Streptomyces sp. H28]|uniref:sulfurtransferase n=1 Tax=Streptomyces sp. H28 TaxID=2775865 RepID=UPI0019B79E40